MPRRSRGDYTYAKFLQEHLDDYLERQKATGGFKDGWKTALRRDLLGTPSDISREAMIELALLAADALWEKPPPPGKKQLSLFTIAGFGIETTYTFRDDDVPGGHRRVLGRYATPNHMIQDAEITQKKAREAENKGNAKMEAAQAALIRCGGDLHAQIWDQRDRDAA